MWLLLLLGSTAAPLVAQSDRPLSITTSAAVGWRPVVRLQGVLQDRALRGALTSGLPLRFRLRTELWEDQGLFDRLVGAEQVVWSMVQSPLEGGYTLDNGRVQQHIPTLEGSDAALQGAFTTSLQPRGTGRFYYIVTLNVESLSLSDLEELQRWLRGEARPAVQGRAPAGRAVEQGLRRVFVRVIGLPTRHWEARTTSFVLR